MVFRFYELLVSNGYFGQSRQGSRDLWIDRSFMLSENIEWFSPQAAQHWRSGSQAPLLQLPPHPLSTEPRPRDSIWALWSVDNGECVWCRPHLSGLQLLPCRLNPSSGAPASNNPELLPGNPCPIPAKRSLVPALRSVSSSSVTSNCFICLPRQLGQDRPQLQKIKVKTSSIIWWMSWGLWYLRWRIFEQDKQLPIPRPPLRRKLDHRLVFPSGPPHKSNPNLSLAMLPFHTLSPLQKKK